MSKEFMALTYIYLLFKWGWRQHIWNTRSKTSVLCKLRLSSLLRSFSAWSCSPVDCEAVLPVLQTKKQIVAMWKGNRFIVGTIQKLFQGKNCPHVTKNLVICLFACVLLVTCLTLFNAWVQKILKPTEADWYVPRGELHSVKLVLQLPCVIYMVMQFSS